MTKFYQGIAGKRGASPKGIVLHNDAGSENANAAFYRRWLAQHEAENGFAHYYVASDGTYQAESEQNMAWHAGNRVANREFIGIEVCQSLGPASQFLANEQRALQLAATILRNYHLPINRQTVRLHQEFSATSCPHRAIALHGGTGLSAQEYFITQIARNEGGQSEGVRPPQPPAPGLWQAETGTFVLHAPISLRVEPTTKANRIAVLPAGSRVRYDQYKVDYNGHVWIRQPRTGCFGYLATGASVNGVRVSTWGQFY